MMCTTNVMMNMEKTTDSSMSVTSRHFTLYTRYVRNEFNFYSAYVLL